MKPRLVDGTYMVRARATARPYKYGDEGIQVFVVERDGKREAATAMREGDTLLRVYTLTSVEIIEDE